MTDAFTIEDIVDVIITLGDRPITQAGFSTPLLLVETNLTGAGEAFENDRVKIYTSVSSMIDEGFLVTDPAYRMAVKCFSGDNPPDKVLVGNWDKTGGETLTEAVTAVAGVNSDFFFLLTDSHLQADVLEAAEWANANKRIYIVSLQDADIISATAGNTLEQLNALQYDNTMVLVHQDADAEFVEGGVVGAMAGLTPGVSTLHGKTLQGVAFTTFSRTESEAIESQKGNIYTRIGGVGFFRKGFMVSGRYFDIIRGSLYLEARMEEDVFGFIKRKSDLGTKVPYTDNGVNMIKGVMEKRLQISVDQGFLSDNPPPRVIPPLVQDIPTNDKANRLLPDVPFEATLAGAIHTVKIRGYVSV